MQRGSFERRWKTSSSLATPLSPALPTMTFHIADDCEYSSSGGCSGDGSGEVERFLMRVEERVVEGRCLRRNKVFPMRFWTSRDIGNLKRQ